VIKTSRITGHDAESDQPRSQTACPARAQTVVLSCTLPMVCSHSRSAGRRLA
jgi:hypothetical protein